MVRSALQRANQVARYCFYLLEMSGLSVVDMMMTNNHVRLFFGWSDAFVSLCRHTEEPRHWGRRRGWVRGLSVSSGPSDSFLWAGGDASVAAPVAAAAGPGLAAVRRARHEGAGTGAAPGSWRAAVLAVSSKCLSGIKMHRYHCYKRIFSENFRENFSLVTRW